MEKKVNKEKEKIERKVKENAAKVIEKNLPAVEAKWITQPLSITMMRADLSPMQVSLMVEMIDHFQENIQRQLEMSKDERMKMPSLFTEEEEREGTPYVVRFPLKDLGIRPDAYGELYTAAEKLQAMQIKMPVVKSDGSHSMAFFSLFSRIEIPVNNKEYKYKGGTRRSGYIEMSMNRDAYNDVMRIGSQYTKYIKHVTRECKCNYSARIYMWISTYQFAGTWTVDYMELHQMFGFSTIKDGKVVFLRYELFSDMKRRVLEPAQKELKVLCDRGVGVCYFDYEPIFPKGKTRGLPEKIVFTIHTSEYGKELQAASRGSSEFVMLEQTLKNSFQLSTKQIAKIMNLVTEENRSSFTKKVQSLKSYIDNPDNQIKNKSSYAWESLHDWLQSHRVEVVEIKDDTIKETPIVSEELVVEEVKTYDKEWNEFVRVASTLLNDSAMLQVNRMNIYSITQHSICFAVKQDVVAEMVCNLYGKEVKEAVYKVFGVNKIEFKKVE